MRITIDIDDTLMAEAQKACGSATKKQTVEQALRLMIRLRRQQEVGSAFGKYRWLPGGCRRRSPARRHRRRQHDVGLGLPAQRIDVSPVAEDPGGHRPGVPLRRAEARRPSTIVEGQFQRNL